MQESRSFLFARLTLNRLVLVGVALVVSGGCDSNALSDSVTLMSLPAGARLPHAAVDDNGTVHAVYFEGEERAGDLFYVSRTFGESTWSTPQRVNSEPETVVGIGPIDGGQIAVGKDGRIHVVWFKLGRTDFLYTRSMETGKGFEPQFALAAGEGVEAGPSVAADDSGNVYVFWHTGAPPDAERAVYMAVSHDDGRIFEPARQVNDVSAGTCDCCGLRALAGVDGNVHVSYRGAGGNVNRGQRLLTSRDAGLTFSDELIDPWEINACPISTTDLASGPGGATVAWETAGQVFFGRADSLKSITTAVGTAEARRKNPAIAVNNRGETLLAWGDGYGWQSGGVFHWQLYSESGEPMTESGSGPEIPEGSRPSLVSEQDGTFLVVF